MLTKWAEIEEAKMDGSDKNPGQVARARMPLIHGDLTKPPSPATSAGPSRCASCC